MSLRILIYLECDKCRTTFDQQLVSAQALHSRLTNEVHELVIAAEDENWQCRRNATEHYCTECVEVPF